MNNPFDAHTNPVLYQLAQIRIEDATAEQNKRDEEDRQKAEARQQTFDAKSRELYAKAKEFIPELLAECGPQDSSTRKISESDPDSPPYIPLRLGPGPDYFLSLKMAWVDGVGECFALCSAGNERTYGKTLRLPCTNLPAMARLIAFSWEVREEKHNKDFDNALNAIGGWKHYFEQGFEAKQARDVFDKFTRTWPDSPKAAELAARLDKTLAEIEQAKACKVKEAELEKAEAHAAQEQTNQLLRAISDDPLAMALVHMFVLLKHERSAQAEAIEAANTAAWEAENEAMVADRRADDAQRKADRASSDRDQALEEARDAEDRAGAAEKKLKKLNHSY